MVGKKSNDAYSLRPQNMKSTAMIKWCLLQVNVACGEDGAVKGLGQGKGYVDVSTVDGDTSKAICKAVQASGAEFLEVISLTETQLLEMWNN
jgi:hypothetical protein